MSDTNERCECIGWRANTCPVHGPETPAPPPSATCEVCGGSGYYSGTASRCPRCGGDDPPSATCDYFRDQRRCSLSRGHLMAHSMATVPEWSADGEAGKVHLLDETVQLHEEIAALRERVRTLEEEHRADVQQLDGERKRNAALDAAEAEVRRLTTGAHDIGCQVYYYRIKGGKTDAEACTCRRKTEARVARLERALREIAETHAHPDGRCKRVARAALDAPGGEKP